MAPVELAVPGAGSPFLIRIEQTSTSRTSNVVDLSVGSISLMVDVFAPRGSDDSECLLKLFAEFLETNASLKDFVNTDHAETPVIEFVFALVKDAAVGPTLTYATTCGVKYSAEEIASAIAYFVPGLAFMKGAAKVYELGSTLVDGGYLVSKAYFTAKFWSASQDGLVTLEDGRIVPPKFARRQIFRYTSDPLVPNIDGVPAGGPITVTVYFRAPVAEGFTGSRRGSQILRVVRQAPGYGNIDDNNVPDSEFAYFVDGSISSWSFGYGALVATGETCVGDTGYPNPTTAEGRTSIAIATDNQRWAGGGPGDGATKRCRGSYFAFGGPISNPFEDILAQGGTPSNRSNWAVVDPP